MEFFLTYAKGRYLKLTLWLVALTLLVYIFHQPGQPANGGTWYGYTLGTISAVLILWLMYFGRRKRDYHSTLGTVKGWLSARFRVISFCYITYWLSIWLQRTHLSLCINVFSDI